MARVLKTSDGVRNLRLQCFGVVQVQACALRHQVRELYAMAWRTLVVPAT